MNRLIMVSSYTMLANTLMIAIATKLVMLITALLFSLPVLHGRSPSPFYGRGAERIRLGLFTAVVGVGAGSLLLTHHLQPDIALIALTRS
jgi:sorbitol-specific phosphotransferase system component IIBC